MDVAKLTAMGATICAGQVDYQGAHVATLLPGGDVLLTLAGEALMAKDDAPPPVTAEPTTRKKRAAPAEE